MLRRSCSKLLGIAQSQTRTRLHSIPTVFTRLYHDRVVDACFKTFGCRYAIGSSSLGCRSPFAMGIGATRSFSEDIAHFPDIKDLEIKNVFKDFMAANWDELPEPLIHDAQKALSKNTDDLAGKEALANVFRAAEAVEEFTGILVSLKMELDDSVGLSGEDVKELPDELKDALNAAYNRYITYLNSFGPEESYLRKKVETELGTRMIHLKMRCSGMGAEWGKVTVLGTSGLAGSYVEQRAQ